MTQEETEQQQAVSKNARKREERRLRMLEARPARRAREKERKKARRREQLQEEKRQQENGDNTSNDQAENTPKIPFGARVIIDLQWDAKMEHREIVSLDQQLAHCYSRNRNAPCPVQQLIFSSINGRLGDRLRTLGGDRTQTWKGKGNLIFTEQSYSAFWEAQDQSSLPTTATTATTSPSITSLLPPLDPPPFIPKDKCIYLTADSPNVLKELDPTCAYIIGGIVDHNRCKNVTIDLAISQGLQHAQLPIGPFLANLNTRRVLTVNHVFEILLHWIETRDWKTAFERVVPRRKTDSKHAKLKKKDANDEEDGGGDLVDVGSDYDDGTVGNDDNGKTNKVE